MLRCVCVGNRTPWCHRCLPLLLISAAHPAVWMEPGVGPVLRQLRSRPAGGLLPKAAVMRSWTRRRAPCAPLCSRNSSIRVALVKIPLLRFEKFLKSHHTRDCALTATFVCCQLQANACTSLHSYVVMVFTRNKPCEMIWSPLCRRRRGGFF